MMMPMPTLELPALIAQALAPGIALTSVIFYNTGLQGRFLYITGRTRELNREARELMARDDERSRARIASIHWQVTFMARRAESIRRTILIVYLGFFCFILTILQLLLQELLPLPRFVAVPIVSFALGFVAMAIATISTTRELYLSQRTLQEDIRSTFVGHTAINPQLDSPAP